jgi:ATP-dependent DNA helicase RecG
MITQDQLRNLISDLESARVERTISVNNTDKFGEAICAFSNDFPDDGLNGFLLIGVDDKGMPVGASVTDQLLQNLGAIRSDGNVQPMPAMSVYKVSLEPESVEVAVVEVVPSDLPPVRYKGRTWIRVGPRRAIATEMEERLLSERRTSHHLSFDTRPCQGAHIGDLSLELFILSYRSYAIDKEVLEENHRNAVDQLASLRFFDLGRGCPTFGGLLLFGKNPLHWLPGAYIQFVRYDGSELSSEVREEKVFSGDLVTVLREMDIFIGLQIVSRPVQDSTLHENQESDYPQVAIRELLLNAVLHRTYESNSPIRFYWFENRVEIQSPGGLYGEATIENFPRQNSYRNPVIAEALKNLGYVNKFGRGVYRAQDALAKNGNPPATFQFESTFVLATISSRTQP